MFSVIFEVHPDDGMKDDYLGHAKNLKPIVETIDGFIDNERFESRLHPGWVLSLSTWRDEKSLIRWRTEARHHIIQAKGRSEVFSDYHLRVGEITADSDPPMPLREERFDTTETGTSKLCTIVELVPKAGQALPSDHDALLDAIGLDREAPGLNDVDIYDSIYNPGKVLVLGSWAEPDHAAPYWRGEVAGAEHVRNRAVRVIRAYGMFDRRETPQYYPEARRKR